MRPALISIVLSLALAGAAVAAGPQFHPEVPGLLELLGDFIRCDSAPAGTLPAFDVLEEAEFLDLLDPSWSEEPAW
jgi:hypothetical protein